MPDYSKGCIYKIKHKEDYDDENIYVGSTCNIIRRRCQHKSNLSNENSKDYNAPVYKYIRDNGGWDDFILIKIHDYPCKDKDELNIEERRMVDILKSKLNMRVPARTQKEYYEDKKEIIKERVNKYREDNKEDINEKRKEKITCDCGCIVTKRILKLHKITDKHHKYLNKKNLIIK